MGVKTFIPVDSVNINPHKSVARTKLIISPMKSWSCSSEVWTYLDHPKNMFHDGA